MDVKVVETVLACGTKVRTSLKTIHEFVGSTPDRLMAELASQGIKPTGSQIWHYTGCDGNPETEFDLLICVPVERKGQDRGGFEFLTLDSLKCACAMHEGAWNDLGKAYEGLKGELVAEGLQMAAVSREVYHRCDFENPANCITEIQLEVR
jgi:effector-binding domain-containing protein